MKSSAWFLRDGELTELTYRIQINDVGSKSDKKIMETLSDWALVAEFWYSNNNKKGFVFQKVFADQKAWKAWTKNYPYPLEEISSISNRVKTTTLGTGKVHKSRGRPKGRRCGKCGEIGHNARTCKGAAQVKKISTKSKIPRKHRKKCSYCYQFDHNVRSCKKKKDDLRNL